MSKKDDLIKEMLAMQKKFVEYEHKNGVDMKDYYVPDESHPLYKYREKYSELADQVNAMAHEEKGSKRFY